MDNEIWKPIFQGYEVSNLGSVRSTDIFITYINGRKHFRKGKILSQKLTNHGYKSVHLSISNKSKHLLTHRIVAIAFLGLKEKMCINHKNGIKTDNRVENLEWVTARENTKHAYLNGLMRPNPKKGDECIFSVLRGHEVVEIRNQHLTWLKEISSKYNVSKETIRQVIRGNSWKHLIEKHDPERASKLLL